jgi:hypothetical protein
MRNKFYAFFLFVLPGLLLTRCSQKDNFSSAQLTDYMNLSVGKYVTYRMDSLVFTNFGQTQETHSYQAKDVVDGTTTDNLGRLTWGLYVPSTIRWRPAPGYNHSLIL